MMVWGCMGWNGVGIAVEVEGNLTKEQYVKILEEALLQSMEKLGVSKDHCHELVSFSIFHELLVRLEPTTGIFCR